MITQHRTDSEPGVTRLVGSIIEDIQDLFKKQLELFRHEVKDDLRQTKEAGLTLAAGLLVLFVGSILLCITLVYLLEWAFAPDLPLWGAYGIVGATMSILGTVLLVVGKRKFATFNPLPDKSVEVLTENLQWTSNSK